MFVFSESVSIIVAAVASVVTAAAATAKLGPGPQLLRPGFLPLTSVPVQCFQKSTAAALCDLTTEVLRTINATEKAIVEFGLSEPADRQHSVAADVKQADDAFRELEENVSFNFQCLHMSVCSNTAPTECLSMMRARTGFKPPTPQPTPCPYTQLSSPSFLPLPAV